MLAAATKGRYHHEPFNFKTHPERKSHWLAHREATSQDTDMKTILSQVTQPFGWKEWITRRNIVIKDVHIWTAAPFVDVKLQPNMVIIVRHPCAVAASWARLEYSNRSIDRLLKQKSLVDRYLKDYVPHINSSNNYFFRIGAFWGAAYQTLAEMTKSHRHWTWVKHENMCEAPYEMLKKITSKMGVDCHENGHRFIYKQNTETKSNDPYSAKRKTKQQKDKWKDELSHRQQQNVIDGASAFPIFKHKY